jgi:hypothetical protein
MEGEGSLDGIDEQDIVDGVTLGSDEPDAKRSAEREGLSNGHRMGKLTLEDQKAIDFRVALALSKYGFGAMYTARHLLRSRGMVQSWKKMGERHYLARMPVNGDKVTKRLWKIRRVTTFKDLDYHMATRLFTYDLSSSYIAKRLGIPISTVNSWRKGNSPSSVRDGFIDTELVDSKFTSLLAGIKRDLTTEHIDYFLALRISEDSALKDDGGGTRNIGARTISGVLKGFLGTEPLPERTVSSWIKGERKPHNIEQRLIDEEFINERFQELVLELTKQQIDYHIAMELAARGWQYSAIALFLHLNKEKVRGWIKKGRGSPLAKTFKDQPYVDRVLRTMLASSFEVEAAMACSVPRPPSERTNKKNGKV